MYAKELEKITDALDQMLLKKEITMGYENADTLSAKILTQLHRINAANNGYQNFLQQEKEGIKKLLAEISISSVHLLLIWNLIWPYWTMKSV